MHDPKKINVFEIARMAAHNGPGMRTMVHLKGCPLRCIWCSTPESQKLEQELLYDERKCYQCGKCIAVCPPKGIKQRADGKVSLDRSACTKCFVCAELCYGNALTVAGKAMSAREVFAEIIKDKPFFKASGGGATFSGGEPLMCVNDEFIKLLGLLKSENIPIGFDTTGYAPREILDLILPFTDFFLWDIKALDDAVHKKYTGVSNKDILKNLFYVNQQGLDLYLRCPIIPGINDDSLHLKRLCQMAVKLGNVKEIHIMPLHHLGIKRYEKLNRYYPMRGAEPVNMEAKKAIIESYGLHCRIIG